MTDVTSIVQAAVIVLSWPTVGWVIFGVALGVILGVIPGLGPNLGMAVLIPLTFRLDGSDAIIFLVAMYIGTVYGGSVPAILMNTPGTAGAVATTLDGYPMARLGEAKDALVISATSSAIGGLISSLGILLISPILVGIVLLFGSPEFFLIALFGLVLITLVSQGSMVKGLTAGGFGLLLSTIGTPVATGLPRFTFGFYNLYNGLSFVAILIGVFAIGEMINLLNEGGSISQTDVDIEGPLTSGISTPLTNPIILLKSSIIGVVVGAVPGAGSAISNFVSYMEALRSDSDPESFGDGNPKGVIAAEAANSSTVAGSLVPTLSFGIPGSGATAVLLAGLLAHGISPGPSLFQEDILLTNSLFVTLAIASVLILIIGLGFVSKLFYFTKIDINYIIPVIIVLVLFGTYAMRNNWVDVICVVVFGFAGFYMREYNYSLIAFVLGIILGPIAEENLLRSLQLSSGAVDIFWSSRTGLILTCLIMLFILTPVLQKVRTDNLIDRFT